MIIFLPSLPLPQKTSVHLLGIESASRHREGGPAAGTGVFSRKKIAICIVDVRIVFLSLASPTREIATSGRSFAAFVRCSFARKRAISVPSLNVGDKKFLGDIWRGFRIRFVVRRRLSRLSCGGVPHSFPMAHVFLLLLGYI